MFRSQPLLCPKVNPIVHLRTQRIRNVQKSVLMIIQEGLVLVLRTSRDMLQYNVHKDNMIIQTNRTTVHFVTFSDDVKSKERYYQQNYGIYTANIT